MGMGRADEDDEVEVEGVADAFEDAHQSDDDGDYDANADRGVRATTRRMMRTC